jgi:hypothetical protein
MHKASNSPAIHISPLPSARGELKWQVCKFMFACLFLYVYNFCMNEYTHLFMYMYMKAFFSMVILKMISFIIQASYSALKNEQRPSKASCCVIAWNRFYRWLYIIFLDLLCPFRRNFFRTSLCVLCTHIESRFCNPHVAILRN